MAKKLAVFLRTFGCQMNVRDSEVICGLLQKAGYKISAADQDADVIIFNTCSVRKHAEDRIWSLIGSYKGSKVIGLVGCMAQNYKEQAFARDANISFVVGPQDIHKLPDILNKFTAKNLWERKIWETDGKLRPEEIYHTDFYQDKNHAYVVISEGCSNFCSYCVVPYVRGPLRHRKQKDILTEIRSAIAQGITRVTLLGQNVNAYQDGQVNFTRLLGQVNGLKGLKEFDFFTSHPKDAGNDFFKAIRDLERLVKRLHLPLQSGSDRILKLMNRGYQAKDYLALIDSYRRIVKGGLLTSDIIVGFPGETEQEFRQTCALVKKARFNAAYIFKYSSRPGTQAAKMMEQLKVGELEKRHKKILDLQRGVSRQMQKIKLILVFLVCFVLPRPCWAGELDTLKTDFLQGNYRRVIFEGQAQVQRMHLGNTDELNYILGLSCLAESKLDLAQGCFRRILNNSGSKFRKEADLALADTYLVSGQFQQAEASYNKLINDDSNSRQKPAVWYRLSQLEAKRGNHQKSNEYLFKLKRDFPLSPELRTTKGIVFVNTPVAFCEPVADLHGQAGEYSIQVGFFTSSANANNFKDVLLSKNYPAYVEDSGTGYRVKVGRFKSQKEAQDLESKLSRDGFATKVCPL